MIPGPLKQALDVARGANPEAKVIYLSPQGRRFDQAGVLELAARPGLILLAGRYEGVDQRLIENEVDEEWSIGDYVLSGGELAAMVMVMRWLVSFLEYWAMRIRRPRIRLRTDCSTARTTRGPRSMRDSVCRRCCCPATTPRSGAGASSRHWGGPGNGVRILERIELDAEQKKLLDEYRQEKRR